VPELPEVQAHAERLDAEFAGATLERFTPLAFTALKTAVPAPEEAYGQDLLFVGRRGKQLLADFGTVTFVVHLMQGGRLKVDEKQSAKPRGGQARWRFSDGRALLLTEAGTERKAGVWVLAGDPEAQPPLDELGPDADTVDAATLRRLLDQASTRLHGFLRDQRRIAGLGRRLANEVCHRAHLSPFATTSKLGDDDVAALVEAIQVCIAEGLAFERGLTEMSSSAERPGNVHHRVGEACPVCGDEIVKLVAAGRGTYVCQTCQRPPRARPRKRARRAAF
jgi:formamidopyrimidine-DNA glycosylase